MVAGRLNFILTEKIIYYLQSFIFKNIQTIKLFRYPFYFASKNHPLEFSAYTSCQYYRYVDVKIA